MDAPFISRCVFEACRDGLDPEGPGPLDPLNWPDAPDPDTPEPEASGQ